MTPADLFRKLSALGLDTEQIAGVLELMDADAEDRKEKGRARWRKWKDNQPTNVSKRLPTTANVSSQLVRGEDSSSKKVISGKEVKKDRAPAAPTPCQELESVLDHERAQAVVDHRQRLKKPLTAYAAKQLASKLSKAPDANVAADAMIANGWQGFEAGWLENRTTRPHSTASPPPGKRMNAVEANLARRIRRNEPEGGRRDNGDAELLPPDRPGLPDFVRDAGKSLTWDG